jgi:hypothetical protein
MRGELARIVGCACQSLDLHLRRHTRPARPRRTGAPVTAARDQWRDAGNTLRQTLGGAVLPWQDVLHRPGAAYHGDVLLRTRAVFLSACGWGNSRGSRPRWNDATGSSCGAATGSRWSCGSSTTYTTSSSSSSLALASAAVGHPS